MDRGDDMSQDESGQSQSKKSKKTPAAGQESDSKADSQMDGDDSEQMDSDANEDYGEESEDSDEMVELPSQNEMKKDLIQAIEEELREQDQLRRENDDL